MVASSEEEEEEEEEGGARGEDGGCLENITQYEMLRLQRIQQNKAKLAALRLPDMASRLASSASEGKSKRLKLLQGVSADSDRRLLRTRKGTVGKKGSNLARSGVRHSDSEEDGKNEKDDKDYDPSDIGVSETDSESSDEEEPEGAGSAHLASNKKGEKHDRKNLVSIVPHNDGSIGLFPSRNSVATDDFDLQQAIALSLGESFCHTFATEDHQLKQESSGYQCQNHVVQKQVGRSSQKNAASEKTLLKPIRRKNQRSILQFTGGEFDALFLSFLGARQAHITLEDLERVSVAHDFIWDEDQIQDMITFFDTDIDGQLSLEDFREMGVRLKVLKET